MMISCTSCKSKYLINSADLKPDGRIVQCANCGNQWYQEIETISMEENLEILPSSQSTLKSTDNNKNTSHDNKFDTKIHNLPSTIVEEQKYSILNSILALLSVTILFLIFLFIRKLEINTLVLIKFYIDEFYFNFKMIIDDLANIIHQIFN